MLQDGDVGVEPGPRGEVGEHAAQGRLGELAGDEQDPRPAGRHANRGGCGVRGGSGFGGCGAGVRRLRAVAGSGGERRRAGR